MEYNSYVISAGRSKSLPFTDDEKKEFIFLVPGGQKQDYIESGCTKVYETGNLIQSRNWALEDSFEQKKICFQISDDLISIKANTNFFKEQTFSISSIIKEFHDIFSKARGVNLIGIAPTPNPYFAKKIIQKNGFVIGDFFGVKPTPIRFDSNLTLKEDYDFTLQHYKFSGIVLRYQKYMFQFKHYTNKGGVVDYRNEKEEKKNIEYLLEKWPQYLSLNPKRENEILLKIKKTKFK